MSIVALFGSPSANSRSTALLRDVLGRIGDGTPVAEIALRDLPPAALMHADFDDPAIRHACRQVGAARFVLIATPIYKASFSGLLKTFLDLLPEDGLRGKTVLALGTGGSAAHQLALDYALAPVLSALGARHLLDSVYAVDSRLVADGHGGYQVHDDLAARIERVLVDAPFARPSPPTLCRVPELADAPFARAA